MSNRPIVFVTGGTGFLGQSLLPQLVEAGYHVRALTRRPEDYEWLRALPVEVIQGDIEDAPLVNNAVQGATFIVHAAGRFRFWGKQEQFEQTNIVGARNVLEAGVAAGVQKFIHISTLVVIGQPQPNLLIDENHPTRPLDPYQQSKLAGEQTALTYFRQHALPVVILRPGAFYGPGGHYAFNRLFIEDPLKGLRIKVDGGHYHTFPVYIHDVAQSVLLGLQRGTPGEIYNISGECLTHNEVNAIISEEAGISSFRVNMPGSLLIALASAWTWLSEFTNVEPYYPLNLRSYVFNDWQVSIEKACRELGFTPTPFQEGIRATLAWYRKS
jgi:dihydroflavonol-4-reductase